MGRSSRLKRERREHIKHLILYHYTTNAHVQAIFKSGYLMPTDQFVNEIRNPVVWLSENSIWDNSVKKRVNTPNGPSEPLGIKELHNIGIIPVRIQIDHKNIKIYNWKRFKRICGISLETLMKLEDVMRQWDANMNEWWMTFNQISVNDFISVSIWNGIEWCKTDLDDHENFDTLRNKDFHDSL